MVTIEGCMIVNVMTIACGDQLGIPLSTRFALLTLTLSTSCPTNCTVVKMAQQPTRKQFALKNRTAEQLWLNSK